MRYLALDVGSTSIKGAVLDADRREISHIRSAPFPAPVAGLPALHFEVEPQAIEIAARGVIESLLEVAPDAQRVYVAGQMGGLVLLGPGGEPLSNYISWQDQRTLAPDGASPVLLVQLGQRIGEDWLQSLGRELQPGSTLALLSWLQEHGKLPPEATPMTVADYLISRVCQAPGHMHLTQAVGLLDLTTLDWHQEVFQRLGLECLAWPRLERHIEPVGQGRFRDRELAVYGSYGDQQCALYGVGLERGELSINISTGSQVSRRIERLVAGDAQTRPYFCGDLLQTITHLPAGRSLNVLVRLLTELASTAGGAIADPWDTILRLAEGADRAAGEAAAHDAPAELHVDLSFFGATHGASGSITGITTENLTAGQLFRAAFRAMADNYASSASRLDPQRSYSQIVLSGSLSRSARTLRRMIQHRFNVPLRQSEHHEETLLGLLRLAGG